MADTPMLRVFQENLSGKFFTDQVLDYLFIRVENRKIIQPQRPDSGLYRLFFGDKSCLSLFTQIEEPRFGQSPFGDKPHDPGTR